MCKETWGQRGKKFKQKNENKKEKEQVEGEEE